jgi:hypothetical protein
MKMSLKTLYFLSFSLINLYSFGQYNTNVVITDIYNPSLKAKMEHNASVFLTEINQAFFKDKKPRIDETIITEEAKKAILTLWEMSSFRCYETDIFEKGINCSKGGYEVRNIPLFMKEADSLDKNQEAVIVFNTSGLIDNLYLSMETTRYKQILSEGKTVTDFRRRQIILDFIENFRTAYNRKDIDFLNKVYSNDALIITGKVVKTAPQKNDFMQNNLNREQIVYQKQTKEEYLSRIKITFRNNSYLNIKFDSIEVSQHPVYPEIFGILLKQSWNAPNYRDVGYLFLMIDFQDENNPLIHIRTWQPNTTDLFNLGKFNIIRN